jgi:hypothetical protein
MGLAQPVAPERMVVGKIRLSILRVCKPFCQEAPET